MHESKHRASQHAIRWPGLWALILIIHIAMLSLWLWLAPHGFPVSHSRFWVNIALPGICLIVLTAGVYNLAMPSRFRNALLMLVPGFWTGMGIAVAVLFPKSSQPVWSVVGPGALFLLMLSWRSLRWQLKEIAVLAVGAIVGVGVAWSQQAPIPSTRSGNEPHWTIPETSISSRHLFADNLSLDPVAATVSIALDRQTRLTLHPLLSFHSRSPDRFWTCFADLQDQLGPRRHDIGLTDHDPHWGAFYSSDFSSYFWVTRQSPGVVDIKSISLLNHAIYSHLNSYCSLEVDTRHPLSVVFSPCPNTPIDIRASGQPAHIAYLNENGFYVVEPSAAEKGPFTEVASGSLKRGDPLGMMFLVDDTPACRVELNDWSQQASFDLSPTAGWGLPMNAIVLWPTGSGCQVRVTLAGTSVGRGYDSVGHSAGSYLSRIRIEYPDE